ncbi:MAG: hypothetical protein WAU07_05275 [Microgenomates group bacterium]
MFAVRTLFSSLFRSVSQTQLFREGGFLIGASVATNALMLLYNLYLGRRLEFGEFGLVVAIISVLNVLQLPLTAYARAITHRAAYFTGKNVAALPTYWHYFRKTAYLISGLLTIAWLIATPWLMQFFHVSRALPFILVSPLWLVSVAAAVDSGFLLGMHRFKRVAQIVLIDAVLYVLWTVLLVELGLGRFLYTALPLSSFVSFFLGWWAISREIKAIRVPKKNVALTLDFPWKFFVNSGLAELATMAFITFDVLLVKHFLPPTQAGRYVTLAVVGKMVFYASSLMGQFVVPMVSKEMGSGKNPRGAFMILFGIAAVLLLGALLVLGVFGNFTVPLLLGEKANSIVAFLPWYLVGMSCFGLATMIVSFYQAKQDFAMTFNSILASLMVVVGIVVWHDSVRQISLVMGLSGVLSLLFAFVQISFRKTSPKMLIHKYIARVSNL